MEFDQAVARWTRSDLVPAIRSATSAGDQLRQLGSRFDKGMFDYLLPQQMAIQDIGKDWLRQTGSSQASTHTIAGAISFTGLRTKQSIRVDLIVVSIEWDLDEWVPYVGSVFQLHNQRDAKTLQDVVHLAGMGEPCLYTKMINPAKLLMVAAIARAAGVTHIVEEGRAGGLSAYVYWYLGFNVTSVEYMPIDDVGQALRAWAPTMTLFNGDGHEIVPWVIQSFGPDVAARTMVIFDGEKRKFAYQATFSLVRQQIALAAFDDSVRLGYMCATSVQLKFANE